MFKFDNFDDLKKSQAMDKIVVFLRKDYSLCDYFYVQTGLTKEQITEEVNKRYPIWYYYDIWSSIKPGKVRYKNLPILKRIMHD